MARVKTEHRKGELSKTTCREICRYYINGKGQCEGWDLKMDVIPELERRSALGTLCSSKNGFTGDLYGLATLAMFKAILRDRSNLFVCKARTAIFGDFGIIPMFKFWDFGTFVLIKFGDSGFFT